MNISVIGTNHKFSPLWFREKLYAPKIRREKAASLLKQTGCFQEAIFLYTCNRIEWYVSKDILDNTADRLSLEDLFCFFHNIDKETASPHLYFYQNEEAVTHLFMVGAGVDSLVLGEKEIIEQLKASYQESFEYGFSKGRLDLTFRQVITSLEKLRCRDVIRFEDVSLARLVIDFIKKKQDAIFAKDILIIGTGKISQTVAESLVKENSRIILVAGRTFEKAKELAVRLGQRAAMFTELSQLLSHADIIITATKSPHVIITRQMLAGRRRNSMLILDLAIPRDVEPTIDGLDGIELYNLEDLVYRMQDRLTENVKKAKIITPLLRQEAYSLWKDVIAWEHGLAPLP